MRVHLIAPAILALVIASPATAQLAPQSGPSWNVGHPGPGGWHRDRHHRRDRNSNLVVGYWDSGTWALYNNRGWEPESYNDWWHERPLRNTPRWVMNNQDCQRQYWSGGGWRC